MPSQKLNNQLDLSGAVQVATSHLLRRNNEIKASTNANFNAKIGAIVRRPGYEQVGKTIEHGKDSLGAGVYRYFDNNKIIVGINDDDDSNATLRYLSGDNWETILSDAAPNTRFQFLNHLDEYYVAGADGINNYLDLTNIDSTLVPSTTRNVLNAPQSKYIAEYNGRLYAINVKIDGKVYKDRAYYSSPPFGPITFVQTDQVGRLWQLRVDATQYLKPGMVIDIYGKGTEAKKVSALTIISIDKKNKRISFAPRNINVGDNDELWLQGRKNQLSHFWNTDDPTPEQADFINIPAGRDANPDFTGWGKNNNRLLLFTKDSFYKFDSQNTIQVSSTVGCVSHDTIQNIGSWTLWLHNSGVWGYNDNTGQLKLLSRAIQPYIDAIQQVNLSQASAGAVGQVYKLAVGELLPLDSVTTSTSTSSTSTSSTSSSTSSTSTSSTSTSSTSSSTSISATTSTSTSSTSTSSTSTSISTSSTSSSTSSTSTSTVPSSREVIRFCYDFDMNAWWMESHKRDIRYQFNHNMHGYTKPYFADNTGRLFRDETGNLDHVDTIPLSIQTGRNNFGLNQLKNFLSVITDSEKARGAQIHYSVDGGQFQLLGEITKNVETFDFPQSGQMIEGKDIDFQLTHNDSGEAPEINGLTTYYSLAEAIPDGKR